MKNNKLVLAVSFIVLFFNCAFCQNPPVEVISPFAGISGMVQLSSKEYLIVHDTKNFQPSLKDNSPYSRISYVLMDDKGNPIIQKISIPDWEGLYCKQCPKTSIRASDLESICKFPTSKNTFSKNEFIVVESGSWKKRNGRIYKIKIDFCTMTGSIENTITLPILAENKLDSKGKDIVGDQFEGCICDMNKDENLILVLAERGGSAKYEKGIIRWGALDFSKKMFAFSSKVKTINLNIGNWINAKTNRDITDFYVDKKMNVWASAAEEPKSGLGPFYSIIYKLGKLNVDKEHPITISISESASDIREIYGLKVEALAAPIGGENKSSFTIGFDDESLGGGWRSIK